MIATRAGLCLITSARRRLLLRFSVRPHGYIERKCVQQNIERLKADCTCVTLDREAQCEAVEEAVGDPDFCRELAATHSHLLSARPVFLATVHAKQMQEIVRAIELVVRLPAYQSDALADAPGIARYRPGAIGVFMGYDFHLSPQGPKLIEINTNAGGALINAYLLAAQRRCCTNMTGDAAEQFELSSMCANYVASFESEWRRQGRMGPLRSIAIVCRRDVARSWRDRSGSFRDHGTDNTDGCSLCAASKSTQARGRRDPQIGTRREREFAKPIAKLGAGV